MLVIPRKKLVSFGKPSVEPSEIVFQTTKLVQELGVKMFFRPLGTLGKIGIIKLYAIKSKYKSELAFLWTIS
jgi:hypothetical protein